MPTLSDCKYALDFAQLITMAHSSVEQALIQAKTGGFSAILRSMRAMHICKPGFTTVQDRIFAVIKSSHSIEP